MSFAQQTEKIVAGGSALEAIAATGTVVLAILGLVGIVPGAMASIGAIVLGGAFLMEGGASATRFSKMLGESLTSTDVLSGLTAETLAGLSGVALGILGLLGVAPAILLSVSVIAFGAALVLSGATVSRFSTSVHFPTSGERIGRTALIGTSSAEVLVGVAATVLGILALIGLSPITLVLVGLLCVAAALLLSGSVAAAKLLGGLR